MVSKWPEMVWDACKWLEMVWDPRKSLRFYRPVMSPRLGQKTTDVVRLTHDYEALLLQETADALRLTSRRAGCQASQETA